MIVAELLTLNAVGFHQLGTVLNNSFWNVIDCFTLRWSNISHSEQ